MSIEAMSRALNTVDARLTPVDRLVLIGIANHDGDGGAWPAVATLARYAGVDPRSARRSVTRLVELGYIDRVIQDGGTRSTPEHKRPNRYVLLIPTGDTSVRGTGDTSVRGTGDTSVPRPPDTSVPRTVLEPSIRKETRGDSPRATAEAVDNLRRAGMAEQPISLERARALRAGLIQPGEALQPELAPDSTAKAGS